MTEEKEVNVDEFQLRRFHKEASLLLEDMRPETYVVSDTTEKEEDEDGQETIDWMDSVAAEVAHLLPDSAAKVLYAREKIGQMETVALRRGNRAIRSFDEQMHLGWLDRASYPIAITTRVVKDGVVRVRVDRVRIRACTSIDFRLFAVGERRKAAADFETRNATCGVAEQIADDMDKVGAKQFHSWVELSAEAVGATGQ